ETEAPTLPGHERPHRQQESQNARKTQCPGSRQAQLPSEQVILLSFGRAAQRCEAQQTQYEGGCVHHVSIWRSASPRPTDRAETCAALIRGRWPAVRTASTA